MIRVNANGRRVILFGVTSSQSLRLLGKIPRDMAAIGWNVHVVVGDRGTEPPRDMQGIELHEVPMARNPSLFMDVRSFFGWMRLIRIIKPTIVVVGTPKAGLLGIVASFLLRVPTRIYHLRGLRLETVSQLARPVFLVIEWLVAKCASHILAVSPSLKQEYCRLALSSQSKVQVLGFGSSHGVDIDHFHPKRWKNYALYESKLRQFVAASAPTLGFVGRFSKDKGAEELLGCSQVLAESGVKHSILVVGPVESDKKILQELRKRSPDIFIAGQVADVAPYYSLMDLLLLPTHREGFPNAVLEAAASGVAAVTTQATGAKDSVIDGHTGVVVSAFDEKAFATAVLELVKDPELLSKLGRNARARAVACFDSNLVSKQHVDFLLRVSGTSQKG